MGRGDMLLQAAIGEFLTYLGVELNRSRATCDGYQKDLRIFTRFLQTTIKGEATPETLTPTLLGEYLQHLTRDRNNQANTVRRRLTALKSFCTFLVENAYLKHNPAASLPRPRMPQRQPRHLQQAEVERLFAGAGVVAGAAGLRDKTMLMFMYYSGVRVSELVNVRREDLDFSGAFIKITKGKGGRFRKVPLHDRLRSQLQQYLEYPDSIPGPAGPYLFCNRQGMPLSTDYVHHMLGGYARSAGINKNVTPHMLRHSFATHLYREEVDLSTLGKLLGHAGIRTTAVYTHTDLKHLRAAVELLPVSRQLEKELWPEEADLT